MLIHLIIIPHILHLYNKKHIFLYQKLIYLKNKKNPQLLITKFPVIITSSKILKKKMIKKR
jgi:hypothetical protein